MEDNHCCEQGIRGCLTYPVHRNKMVDDLYGVLMQVILAQMTWLAGMEGIAADYRHLEGYGVNTFTLVNAEGKSTYVKFHWRPKLGKYFFRLPWTPQGLSERTADPFS
jgi:catalase